MRVLKTLPILCLLLPIACFAQTAPASSARCSKQPAVVSTDAGKAFLAGDFINAEKLYTSQVQAEPTPANFTGLVRSQLEQNKLTQAATSAASAALTLPKSGDVLALSGEVLLRSGQIQPAFTAFTQALAVDPCSPQAHLGVGRLDLIVSRQATAAHEFTVAHSLAPSDATITAAYLETLPEADRTASLKSLLDSSPLLPPSESARLTGLLAVLDQHKTCTAVPYSNAELEMNPLLFSGTHARSWALKTRINDQDLPLLEIDSSVSGIVLNPKDAKRAGVHPLTDQPAPDGSTLAIADKIRIGSVEYHDCPVRVVRAEDLAGLNSLIGLDFFRDHLIHIDYVTKMLSLSRLPVNSAATDGKPTDRFIAPEEKDWTTAYKVGPNLLISTYVNKQGPFLFALDTGSWRTLFSPTTGGKAVTCLHDSTLTLRGTSGPIVKPLPMDGSEHEYSDVRRPDGTKLKVDQPDAVAELRYAGVQYIAQLPFCVDITPKNHAAGIELAGLIGFADLSAFALDINYRDALVHLKYDTLRRYEARENLRDE